MEIKFIMKLFKAYSTAVRLESESQLQFLNNYPLPTYFIHFSLTCLIATHVLPTIYCANSSGNNRNKRY